MTGMASTSATATMSLHGIQADTDASRYLEMAHERQASLASTSLKTLPALIAPLRFGIVAQLPDPYEQQHKHKQNSKQHPHQSQAVYRGSCPRQRHLPFLGRLRIKTILSLAPKPLEKLDPAIAEWASQRGIRLVHVHCDKPKGDGGGLSKDAANKALPNIFDARHLPIYVHCLDGQSVSTLMVAIVRKVQAWAPNAIADEIVRALGRDEEILHYQLNFVETFGKLDGVRLPPRRHIAEWAWSEPSPLRRLRDPYDVLVSSKEKAQGTNEGANSAGHNSAQHSRHISNESGNASSAAPTPPTYGVGALPILHPSLKLRFDPDPDLPPPPSQSFNAHHLMAHQGHNSLLSPASSRPASRTGRPSSQTYTYGHHFGSANDARAQSQSTTSLAGSPRRRMRPAETLGALDARRSMYGTDGFTSTMASPSGESFSRPGSRGPSAASSPRFDYVFAGQQHAELFDQQSLQKETSAWNAEGAAGVQAAEGQTGEMQSASSAINDVFSTPVMSSMNDNLATDTPTPRATSQQRRASYTLHAVDDAIESTDRSQPKGSPDANATSTESEPHGMAFAATAARQGASSGDTSRVALGNAITQATSHHGNINSDENGTPSLMSELSDDEDRSTQTSEKFGKEGGDVAQISQPNHPAPDMQYQDEHTSDHLHSGDEYEDNVGSERRDEVVQEEEEEDEEEEEEDEEEEEEEEEEEDDDSQQGSDLALEALDLEGY